MAMIAPQHVRLDDEPPADWAARLAIDLAPALSPAERATLDGRAVELGEGIALAHLRSGAVAEPRLGLWRASASEAAAARLLFVAVMPDRDPVRHLGWLAQLAAALHDPATRAAIRLAATPAEAAEAVTDACAAAAARRRPTASDLRAPTVAYRMVVAVLKRDEALDLLLARFVERGVQGATVLEARGMAEHLAAHASLFAGFKTAFAAIGRSRIVLALVPAQRASEVLELAREAIGGLGGGIAWAIDAHAVVGLAAEAT